MNMKIKMKKIIFLPYVIGKDKFMDFSYNGRINLKNKYKGKPGIYLWVNRLNKRSYVGKSVDLYTRISKYFSDKYIFNTKNKMAICGAIDKYKIDSFDLYVLEDLDFSVCSDSLEKRKFLSEKENFWYKKIFFEDLHTIFKKFYNLLLVLIIIDSVRIFRKK